MKAINIKWDTDGNEKVLQDLPTEIIIPDYLEKLYESDRENALEEISDWLSEETGFCHDGFEIVDECKALFNKICKPIPTYALSDEIGLDTETSYILNLETKENYVIAKEYLKSLHCSSQDIEEYIGKKIIV